MLPLVIFSVHGNFSTGKWERIFIDRDFPYGGGVEMNGGRQKRERGGGGERVGGRGAETGRKEG